MQQSRGELLIYDSVFAGNVVPLTTGGAIANNGPLTIVNSTFTANRAPKGGGIHSSDVATLTNVTLLSNTAAISGGNLFLNTGSLVVLNTLMAGGVASGTPNNCNIALTSLGHNLDDGDTCGLSAAGDLTNTVPLLEALADNGGPTLTLALLLGSPAIEAGDNATCPATDQRGVIRPQDGDNDLLAVCDIGAYEYEYVTPLRLLFLPFIRR